MPRGRKAGTKQPGRKKAKHKKTAVENKVKKIEIQKTVEVDGVDYDQINGAVCPHCKMPKAGVRHTMPWEDNVRIRHHMCRRCGFGPFKSVEIFHAEAAAQ